MAQEIASERGHWYDRQGNPVYEVPRSDGKGNRPGTLMDARKRNLFPGVTGIIACASKPGLELWKRQQVLLAALTLPRQPDEPEADWIKRVFQDSEEQSRKAAEKGTKIHAAIESYYRKDVQQPMWEYVVATVHRVEEEYGSQQWLPEKSFVSEYGYGCKVDLVSDAVVIDFKTKEFSDTTKKLAWDEHALQLVANRVAAGLYPQAKCANVYVSTSVPGLVHIHEWPEHELKRAWRMFRGLLDYWQADRNYKPVW